MAPVGASIPPHLRRRAAAPVEPKSDVRLGDLGKVTGISTPPASDKSPLGKPSQSQVSPGKVVSKAHTPPSPATTVEGPSVTTLTWNDPKPVESLSKPKRNENLRWPRTSKPTNGRHVWPKAREIPRELSAGSQSGGGITFRSDSGGDPSYDVKKLLGWNGDWLPPPEDWAARKGFTSRHFSQVVDQWANEHSRDCTNVVDIDTPDFFGSQEQDGKWVNKDIVPRYWLHEKIDGSPPRKFWEELPHRAPAAMSDIDIMEDPPYWERWSDCQPNNCFMTTLIVPEARIDQDDRDNELESPFAMLCMEDRIAKILEIRQNRARRQIAKRNRPIPKSTCEGPVLADRQLHPKANMYLRPVQPADIPGIMEIYNHYVKETVHAAELEEQTEAQIRFWIDGIIQAGLPCLVAVSKRTQRKGPQGYVTGKIVGLTYLTDLADSKGMYRFTFELETYIHPGFIHQGIGRCLLDQMMYICNTSYIKRDGYEWVNEFEYLKNGTSRIVKTILASVHYEKGEDAEWATSYLGDFGFKKAGRLSQIGHKAGKVVDKVIFQLQTSEVINPQSIPIIQA
ncbi:uncharacterized protein M421DRAFT_6397 [Didymella exigua CBS 183.55]|uniref:N-acetyltransferase domain-containing protein n=1 Tax=Didymella exigua CBS 183.55 TaxID=1150837 RepID=A0A6A5RNV9_9PLEO|nr:uncharacterized protein M421DRAFT_6397 [Didymella exigua CBS 183.55]KAF1927207.1 hypothetical protein M421DRAFT_6397 [Didymella exigua CBS 183.55]